MQLNKICSTLKKLVFIAIIIFILSATIWYTKTIISAYINEFGIHFPSSKQDFGTLGDYMGGMLNPLLAFLSFIALLYTLKLQNNQLHRSDLQLDLNQKELELTREELAKSANAQVDAKQVMDEQLKTQSLQQFDSLFFSMLRELNSILRDLEISNQHNRSSLDICHDTAINEYQTSIDLSIKIILSNKDISRYFIYLYQLLKIIDDRIDENTYLKHEGKKKLKKMYSNIVRASVNEKAMQLLMINGLNEIFGQYKTLLEKFSFFEHVSFHKNDRYSLLLIHVASLYTTTAFDKSTSFLDLNKSNLFSKFVFQNKLFNYSSLYKNIFSKIDKNNFLSICYSYDLTNGRQDYFCCRPDIEVKSAEIEIKLDGNYEPYQWIIKEVGTISRKNQLQCRLLYLHQDYVIFSVPTEPTEAEQELLRIKFDEEGNLSWSIPDTQSRRMIEEH